MTASTITRCLAEGAALALLLLTLWAWAPVLDALTAPRLPLAVLSGEAGHG